MGTIKIGITTDTFVAAGTLTIVADAPDDNSELGSTVALSLPPGVHLVTVDVVATAPFWYRVWNHADADFAWPTDEDGVTGVAYRASGEYHRTFPVTVNAAAGDVQVALAGLTAADFTATATCVS